MTQIPTHDFSGLICPLPVLKLRRELSVLAVGDSLRMVATDPNAEHDVTHFCQQHAHQLLKIDKSEHNGRPRWVFTITKGEI